MMRQPQPPHPDQVWFMDFSGAPALLLARNLLPQWHGILVPSSDESESDFEDAHGDHWVVHDEFDFDHPVTHYDHLCAAFDEDAAVRVVVVGGRQALAISNGDDAVGWWKTNQAILTNATRVPTDQEWAAATWTPQVRISFEAGDLVLMNSSVHGAQVLAGDDDAAHQTVLVSAGTYVVESAAVGDAVSAFRLRLLA